MTVQVELTVCARLTLLSRVRVAVSTLLIRAACWLLEGVTADVRVE